MHGFPIWHVRTIRSVTADSGNMWFRNYMCNSGITLQVFPERSWLSGIEMDLYKSQISDGVLMGSGTKTKSYKPVSQIACVSVSIVCY